MSIPIPDQMFDEPSGMSMARGGLVAFAEGEQVGNPDMVSFAPQGDGGGGGDDTGGIETLQHILGTAAFMNPVTSQLAASEAMKLPGSIGKHLAKHPLLTVGKVDPGAVFGHLGGGNAFTHLSSPGGGPVNAGPVNAGPVHAGAVNTGAINTPYDFSGPLSKVPGMVGGFFHDLTTGDPKPAPPAAAQPPTISGNTNALADAYAAAQAKQDQTNSASASVRVRGGLGALAGGAPTQPQGTPATPALTLEGAVQKIQNMTMDPATKAYFDGESAKLSKQKKEDVWSTLAQIGFGMAASKNPSFLGAVGEAGNAAVPQMQQAMAARRAAEADMAKQQMLLHQGAVSSGTALYDAQAKLASDQAMAKDTNNLGYAKLTNDRLISAASEAGANARAASASKPEAYQLRLIQSYLPQFLHDPATQRAAIDPHTGQVDQQKLYSLAWGKAEKAHYEAIGAGKLAGSPFPGFGMNPAGGNGTGPRNFTDWEHQQ